MEDAPPFRDLKLRYPIDDLAEALAEGHHDRAPADAGVHLLHPSEIDDLLAYLDSLE